MKKAALTVLACCVFAASSRDAYRASYRAWRQADPNLEKDAASAGAGFSGRVTAVAAQAAKFAAERGAFLRSAAEDRDKSLTPLDNRVPELKEPAGGVRDNVSAAAGIVKKNLDTFANDPDPAIQRLKGMLDRENAALTALSKAVAEREAAAESVKAAGARLESARVKALNANQDVSGAIKLAADNADRESAAWVEYYKKLGEAGSGAGPAVPAATSSTGKPVTPLPLARYTGAWTFPSGGLFHGPQPEFVDLVVHEEGGHATGTLFARFKLAAGSKDDPVLRFDFSGDFKSTRVQSFILETSDGTKGTIELIPGPAFNLLEVNFLTDAKPGKIRQGNVVLVKK
jgi:hypothetical protein